MSFGDRVLAQTGRPVVARVPARRKKLWPIASFVIAVVAAVAGRALGNEVYAYFERPSAAQVDTLLAQVVQWTKPTLPKKLDDVTTMTDISYADHRMSCVYDLDAKDGQERPDLIAALRKTLAGRVCASQMKQAMKAGVSFTFRYNSSAGGEIGEFALTAADCA